MLSKSFIVFAGTFLSFILNILTIKLLLLTNSESEIEFFQLYKVNVNLFQNLILLGTNITCLIIIKNIEEKIHTNIESYFFIVLILSFIIIIIISFIAKKNNYDSILVVFLAFVLSFIKLKSVLNSYQGNYKLYLLSIPLVIIFPLISSFLVLFDADFRNSMRFISYFSFLIIVGYMTYSIIKNNFSLIDFKIFILSLIKANTKMIPILLLFSFVDIYLLEYFFLYFRKENVIVAWQFSSYLNLITIVLGTYIFPILIKNPECREIHYIKYATVIGITVFCITFSFFYDAFQYVIFRNEFSIKSEIFYIIMAYKSLLVLFYMYQNVLFSRSTYLYSYLICIYILLIICSNELNTYFNFSKYNFLSIMSFSFPVIVLLIEYISIKSIHISSFYLLTYFIVYKFT